MIDTSTFSFSTLQDIGRELLQVHNEFQLSRQLLSEASEEIIQSKAPVINGEREFKEYWNKRNNLLKQKEKNAEDIETKLSHIKGLYKKAEKFGWDEDMTITFPLDREKTSENNTVFICLIRKERYEGNLYWQIRIFDEGTECWGLIYHLAKGELDNMRREKDGLGIWMRESWR